MSVDYLAIDAVVNIWTPEALSHRPDWTDEFFVGKVKGTHDSRGVSLEAMLAQMDSAGIRRGFPGCSQDRPARSARQLPHADRGGS